MNRVENIKHASHKLLIALVVSVIVLLILFGISLKWGGEGTVVFPVVMIVGIIGGFVSIQRRIKKLSEVDLLLLSDSNLYPWLSPLAGGLLAAVLYLLFLSGLLAGSLFPVFSAPEGSSGFNKLLAMESDDPSNYAKLLFWCFVAGFSEEFVTNIIGSFEKKSSA